MHKLSQWIAVEKGIKSNTNTEVTNLYKTVQQKALFEGFAKEYQPLREDGVKLPPESKRVQFSAMELLRAACNIKSKLFDVTATKDYANCTASADVVVDGVCLIEKAPVTYLLFLEKELTDIHTFIDKMPTLSAEDVWTLDSNSNVHKTSELVTSRTEKVQDVLTLVQPTDKHPGQAVQITKDVVAGNWKTTKMSGAISATRRVELLEKAVKLLQAVKFAREQANMADAPEKKVGEKVFSWLLG